MVPSSERSKIWLVIVKSGCFEGRLGLAFQASQEWSIQFDTGDPERIDENHCEKICELETLHQLLDRIIKSTIRESPLPGQAKYGRSY